MLDVRRAGTLAIAPVQIWSRSWIRYCVRGMVMAAVLLAFTVPAAYAAEDVVHFGNSIEVSKARSVHDVVCFFCDVNIDGTVSGDVVVFFGSVHVTGQATHDVVNFFGGVEAKEDASIGHNLVNFFGSVRLGENVHVGEDAVVMFGSLHRADSATIAGSEVNEPAALFWIPLLLIVSGVFLLKEIFGSRRRRILRGY